MFVRVRWCSAIRDLAGTRTLDPVIKSHMLYHLSYEIGVAKIGKRARAREEESSVG